MEPGDRIGPYRLIDLLGSGGMGEVFLAEQTEPIHRRVALKVIKLGMDTREFVARFESERQALALMDHPGIARVLDAGAAGTGRPFYVLELVRGTAITRYCAEHRLSLRERLRLFVKVCDAVQHAHQKGVIHRDLKPSNILVEDGDGEPQPKIIDFGVAKAMGGRLTDKSFATVLGQRMGTPAYMSPEQAEMSVVDVDTRTDIYSLGVLLYELLTGSLPLDPDEYPNPYALERAVREAEVERPSQRIARLPSPGEGSPPVTSRDLARDLDWITLRALERDRNRRYETANAFALDIERFLADEPVRARPPSVGYRIGKFVRRNRLAVAAGAAVAVTLVVGTGFAVTGMVRAQAAERRAAEEARAAEEVSTFLTDLFHVVDPTRRVGELSVRELLDRGAEAIGDLADQPRTQARLQLTMGDVYSRIGEWDAALPLLERAVETWRRLGDDPAGLVEALSILGELHSQAGRLDSARVILGEALAHAETRVGPNAPWRGHVLGRLSALEARAGRYAEAEVLARRSLEILAQAGLGESREAGSALNLIGVSYTLRDELDSGAVYLSRAVAVYEGVLGPEAVGLLGLLNNLSVAHRRLGDLDAAEAIATRAQEVAERNYAPDAPQVSMVLHTRAQALMALGRYRSAEPLLRRSLQIDRLRLEPGNPEIAASLAALATVSAATGRGDEADALWREALEIYEKALPSDAAPLVRTLEEYAAFLEALGRADEAAGVRARIGPG